MQNSDMPATPAEWAREPIAGMVALSVAIGAPLRDLMTNRVDAHYLPIFGRALALQTSYNSADGIHLKYITSPTSNSLGSSFPDAPMAPSGLRKWCSVMTRSPAWL